MTEIKHTPGPWSLVETPDEKMLSSWHIQIGEDRVSVFPYTRQYSECRQYSGFVTDHRKMADAKLIAAAPKMLAALIKLHDSLKQLNDCGDVGRYVEEEVEIARSAIAEATQ